MNSPKPLGKEMFPHGTSPNSPSGCDRKVSKELKERRNSNAGRMREVVVSIFASYAVCGHPFLTFPELWDFTILKLEFVHTFIDDLESTL